MPSTATITAFYSFSPKTVIESAKVNSNFSIFRGHILPVDATASSAANNTYDLGSSEYSWRQVHAREVRLYEESTGAHYVGIKSPASITASYDFVLPPSLGATNTVAASNGTGIQFYALSSLTTSPTIQKFTSGSGTYTTPSGCKWIRVRMVGGGGGGAGSSDGNFNAGNGATGGSTTFGTSLLIANGGGPGTKAASAGAPGAGGTGGTATIGSGPIGFAVSGGRGGAGTNNGASVASTIQSPGFGAASIFGGGVGHGTTDGAAPGAGGSGAGGNNQTNHCSGGGGGAGGAVDAIISGPSSTYSYAVGAGGSAGTAGTNGNNGGAGAAGIIIVEEYYQ